MPLLLGLVALLVLPAAAMADTFDAAGKGLPDSVGINSLWVIVAGCFVMFMQAGFAFLEIGFSRGKNAGTVVAKILTNFSIAAILYWAVGFAFAFGGATGHIIGDTGFFLRDFGDPQKAFPIMGLSDATIESKWFFQFVFCAVSLAIVWGTTLERIKFGVYVIYAVVFSALIYPIASGWVFGGGWLQVNVGMQDFAGSTAVHLIGATGALAALLLLGPRRGKYEPDGKARAIPGHNMPLFGLGVLILWLGWFGFNPGSTLGALDGRFTEVLLVTQMAASAGVLGALITARLKTGQIDIGMAGNGAIGALVAITAPVGLRRAVGRRGHRLHRRHHRPARRLRDRSQARRPGRRAHRARPVRRLGHAVVRPVHAAGAGGVQRRRRSRPVLLGLVPPARRPGARRRDGVRVRLRGQLRHVLASSRRPTACASRAEEEEAGLDISEHGMYGYPEQFIPIPELVGYGAAPHVATPATAAAPSATTQEVTA